MMIENDCFRNLIQIIYTGLADMIPTGNIIKRWMFDLYESKKNQIESAATR
jgi:hypothetical protein